MSHIACCICEDPILVEQYRQARIWWDPDQTICTAHDACLARIGDNDIERPP